MSSNATTLHDGAASVESRPPIRESDRVSVALSTAGTFHSFDMARQLEKAGMLESIHTGYPRFKLRNAGIPARKIHSFPWLKGPYMAGWVPSRLRREWEHWDRISFDTYVAATLPPCDVFCALSGSGLRSGRRAKRRGARYVCDRGSSHIRYQDTILREEHDRWGIPFKGVDPRTISAEEEEYEEADVILVPSTFAYRSFVEMGVTSKKLRLAPYGVDLSLFAPVSRPIKGNFDLIFVGGLSVRKGAQYLFSAYEEIEHPRKSLTIAGVISKEVTPALRAFMDRNATVRILGHVPQSDLKLFMSRSHALVLPSIEEGLALVQAQSMACGCPVVATTNTGGETLFDDNVEGFIVPPRDTTALAQALQRLADDESIRTTFAQNCLARVKSVGGWDCYGAKVIEVFNELAQESNLVPAQLSEAA